MMEVGDFIASVATYLLTGLLVLMVLLFANLLIFAAHKEYLNEMQEIRRDLRRTLGDTIDEPLSPLDFLEMVPTLAMWPLLVAWCLWSSFRQGVPCILIKARQVQEELRKRNDEDEDEDT